MRKIGQHLAHYLTRPSPIRSTPTTCSPELLRASLRKGDVLLFEGSSRISTTIKYLTQSTWSHAALHVGGCIAHDTSLGPQPVLIEADVNEGVRMVSLELYQEQHVRICRPVALCEDDINRVIQYAIDRLGNRYDLKNVFDLMRYLLPTPPVPTRWRRQLIALGSGDPTRAICSSLIAQAFQSVRYPILPSLICDANTPTGRGLLKIRHHSLFVPRDFDISPYFRIVKPTIEEGFDPYQFDWDDET